MSFPLLLVTHSTREVISWKPGSHFLGTGKSFWQLGSNLPRTKKCFPGNWEVISWELGSHFPGNGKSFPGNREVISWEPGSHFPGTGKSFPGNQEVITFNPHTILATVPAPVLAYDLPFLSCYPAKIICDILKTMEIFFV